MRGGGAFARRCPRRGLQCLCLCVSAAPSWAGDDGAQYLLFTGGNLWRNGAFTYGGLLWSPDGLDREGFTLKAVMSGGTYHYWSGALGADVTGRELVAQVLRGWHFKRDRLEVKVADTGDNARRRRLDLDHHHQLFGAHRRWLARIRPILSRDRKPQMFASDGYRQMCLSAHLTGFKTEDAEWSAAAGWSDDSDHRTSLYVRFGVLTRC